MVYLLVLKLYNWIRKNIIVRNSFHFFAIFWVQSKNSIAGLSIPESPINILGIAVRIKKFMMRSVMLNIVVKRVLKKMIVGMSK